MLVVPAGFTTRRLHLRHPTLADADAIFAYASDPEVTRYMDWPTQESVASVADFLRGCLERLAARTELTWAITLRPTGRLIGMISCRMREREADFGYILHRAFWGQGLATEAATVVVGWLAGLEHLERIWATCDAANVASARVLEKAGLVREAIRPRATVRPNLGPEPRDTLLFARRSRGAARDVRDRGRAGMAPAPEPWHARRMPDFSLFGEEHVRQYEATGGKVGHDWNGASCLILHTKGRKTGKTRKHPLIYGRDGDDYVVVASNGGAPNNPGWYENLLAHPDVTIQVWDEVIPVTARTGTAEDKKRVWPTMTRQWPDYDKYQAGTKRDIPVVLLRRR